MKTKMEQAMECVVNVYHQYCILDPVDDYLHPKEFQKLMKEQAQPFLKNTMPPSDDQNSYIEKLFQQADKDKNGYLKFTEWLYVIGKTLNEAHERSHNLDDDDSKTPGHGHGHSHGPGHGHGHSH
ncbi:PREDICTED: protein S100-A12-like [Gekko japonicus]|uniref:Protein S100-A12-like n=1 Tax=Gekko japonicus TaxID=146911 RepID=A0ABM1K7B8_GEKJA|nr:PREDICTED: protein S100-A12-like [Gekko japonicus]XP_015269605.1 PREDICTED: protein S100-A12-like [Gekko japonicus]